ncbi:hypothetical protein OHA98_25980 [Streptomyces sp. NBC_00654]|uniref:hypothetical protein n=1 Tax=Streptomyces sp. NBC_00654 TaxID=2975799 RepID=UPI002255C9ED|nr:hypothetical protein [Streptomyces sp. NBC_00654]MCX4968146.1 hypothetical protein [Streptomyces sp. NBC_00654]
MTEGGGTPVPGGRDGCVRTPTSSKPGPEETEEPAARTPAVVHAAGVSIGRTTSEPEGQPDGEASAVAQEEAPTAAKSAAVAVSTAAAGTAAAASSGAGKSAAGKTAEAKTSLSAAEPTPASGTSVPTATTSAATTSEATASEGTASAAAAVAAEPAGATATATAAAAASSSPPDGAAAGEGGAPERPGRVSRPMVVAAAFAGALLLATPFVVASAQKDEAKPESREAAAAWKGDGRAGGYVPGTDPDSPEGKRAAAAGKPGAGPARGDKGPVGDVRADTGDGRKPADGSAEAGTKGAKDTKGGSDSTAKSGSGAKAPTGTGSGTPTKAPSSGSVPKSAPAVVYSGVSGPECPTQRFQKSGYYSDGKEGWATHSGGFGGYGCAGKYLSMPMSGSSSKDSGGSATWLFDLPASARKCSISVHVPGSSDIARVGGDPSYYTVYDRFLPRTSNLVGSYYVRQQERRGTWYNVPGTFAVDAQKLSVQLHDRGEDNDYEHHAISALKVTCTG